MSPKQRNERMKLCPFSMHCLHIGIPGGIKQVVGFVGGDTLACCQLLIVLSSPEMIDVRTTQGSLTYNVLSILGYGTSELVDEMAVWY